MADAFVARYALQMRFVIIAVVSAIIAASLSVSARAAVSSSPSPAPTPQVSVGGVYTLSAFHTYGVNATGALDTPTGADLHSQADITNLLLNVSAASGKLSAGATIGEYAFPTVGVALNPTLQAGANTSLYGALPLVDLSYAPNTHFSVAIGKLATLFGQESGFTYQNFNIERGIGWTLEPTISRGVRATYGNGPWSFALEENDGYYSRRYGSLESMISYAPSPQTTLALASFFPNRNASPNPTASVANKAEYDFMLTRDIGKLQLQPYLLFVNSPASTSLGYARNESAFAGVFLGSYALSSTFSAGFRYEYARDGSAQSDFGANADLLGYGPGSSARTLTLTPTYRRGPLLVRLEFARVTLANITPGFGFGVSGTHITQNRIGLELGVIK